MKKLLAFTLVLMTSLAFTSFADGDQPPPRDGDDEKPMLFFMLF
jgi:hypothetical protein